MDELTALRVTIAEDQEVIESYKQRAEAAEALLRRVLPLLSYTSNEPGEADAAGELEFDIRALLDGKSEVD